jgi:Glycosyl hydrolase family 12
LRGVSIVAIVSAVAAAGCASPAPPPVPSSTIAPRLVVGPGLAVKTLRGDAYHLQADEWNSSAAFTIASDGNADFRVATSAIHNPTDGGPGAYPSLYKGCHWGDCTAASGLPLPVSSVENAGTVMTSDDTSTVAGGAWDDSYDIWFNPRSATGSNGGGLEMMIWLGSDGGVHPAGTQVQSNVVMEGRTYDVWYGTGGDGGTLSFVSSSPTASLMNLDLAPFTRFALARSLVQPGWSLIDVEAGFEVWQGGQGLAVRSFEVCVTSAC